MCMDNYDLFEQHETEQERWLEQRPICSECGEHIQDDMLYEFDGELICPDCMKEHMHSTDNYM